MKILIFAVAAASFSAGYFMANAPVYADSDDIAWIAQCEKDNMKEGASEDIVHKYCACMNNKMSSNETKSITEWEKTHPAEMAACDKESGWK